MHVPLSDRYLPVRSRGHRDGVSDGGQGLSRDRVSGSAEDDTRGSKIGCTERWYHMVYALRYLYDPLAFKHASCAVLESLSIYLHLTYSPITAFIHVTPCRW